MTRMFPCLAASLLVISGVACSTTATRGSDSAAALAERARDNERSCQSRAQCSRPSPILALGKRAIDSSTKEAPRHFALILDDPQAALTARLDMIRGATRSIDLQTYIFDEDDIGKLFIAEFRAAARRGVRVRLLVDQLAGFKHVGTLAALASDHENLELRIYNPVRNQGRARYRDFAASLACCFRQTNQRMHAKVLAVDGHVMITGGRNIQDSYYGWATTENFRDRDVLVAGPETIDVLGSFDRLWESRLSIPAARLADVGRLVLAQGAPKMDAAVYADPGRVAAAIAMADDTAHVQANLVALAIPVGNVNFVTDGAGKHDADLPMQAIRGVWQHWVSLMASAKQEVILQTPYLVLSDDARLRLREARLRGQGPAVMVSTSSLASTDTLVVYALTHKFKQEYVEQLGFRIHEYRPFADGGPSNGSGRRRLHAKSMVVDRRVGVVGTHNFDARSDHYNIESMLVIVDDAFAVRLAESIARDMRPEDSWVLAPRQAADGTRASYASDYQFVPSDGCPNPLASTDPDFYRCYREVGEFPEAGRGQRVLTRLLTKFAGGLVPIL